MSRAFYVTLYIVALNRNLNEKVYCKVHDTKEKTFQLLRTLVQGYLKLADFLEDVLSVSRECVLTAYALMPSSDLLVRIEELAIKSGKLILEDSTNIPNKNKSMARKSKNKNIEVHNSDYVRGLFERGEDSRSIIYSELDEILPVPLSNLVKQDMINVLNAPRIANLNWNMKWPEMKVICDEYLENVDIIINGNIIQHDDLKFYNINVEEYNKFVELNMVAFVNEKGYFSTDNSSEGENSIKSTYSGKSISHSEKPIDTKLNVMEKQSNPKISVEQSQPIQTRKSLRIQNVVKDKTKYESKNSYIKNQGNGTKRKHIEYKSSSISTMDTISEENKTVRVHTNINRNAKPCQGKIQKSVITKEYNGHDNTLPQPANGFISKENSNLNLGKNVMGNVSSSVDSILEENEKVGKNVTPQKGMKKSKRSSHKKQHEDYDYS